MKMRPVNRLLSVLSFFVLLALFGEVGCSTPTSSCLGEICLEKSENNQDTTQSFQERLPESFRGDTLAVEHSAGEMDASVDRVNHSDSVSEQRMVDGGERSDGLLDPDSHTEQAEAQLPEQTPAEMVNPCEKVSCKPGAFCEQKSGSCRCLSGYTGDPKVGCTPKAKPKGWIGTPCQSHQDCNFKDGFCQSQNEGFSGGHCSMFCTRYCPDVSGRPVTFCIDGPGLGKGHCFSRCDTSVFPNNQGCRSGYVCLPWKRYNEPKVVKNVCVPQTWKAPVRCADPINLKGDDNCYFQMVSFGDKTLEVLAKKLLSGLASKQDAMSFLDKNHTLSQSFIKSELRVKTIYANYTKGHHSSRPMKGIILHYTANQREDGTIRYFVKSKPHASTHFVIGSARNGLIVQLFSHKNRTWHAGSTYNIDRFGMDFANAGYLKKSGSGWVDYAKRKYTLSLPLHGNKPIEVKGGIPGAASKYGRLIYWQPYTYYQLLSYVMVGRALHLVYSLDAKRIQRHGDVSSSRVDPGPALPTTAINKLIFTKEDIFKVAWLNQYKIQADWISKNPKAR